MARGAAARGRARTTRTTRRAFDRDARARAIDGVKLVDGARARGEWRRWGEERRSRKRADGGGGCKPIHKALRARGDGTREKED